MHAGGADEKNASETALRTQLPSLEDLEALRWDVRGPRGCELSRCGSTCLSECITACTGSSTVWAQQTECHSLVTDGHLQAVSLTVCTAQVLLECTVDSGHGNIIYDLWDFELVLIQQGRDLAWSTLRILRLPKQCCQVSFHVHIPCVLAG